jgi:hypothetical protein
MTLPRLWRDFASDYLADASHWFVPKGRTVSTTNLPVFRKELGILIQDYEGQVWNLDTEELFARDMEKFGLYKPHKTSPANYSLRAREEKPVLSLLGLVWIDGEKRIHITKVGKALLETEDATNVVSFQILKWQFWNPSIRGAEILKRMQLNPHLCLLNVLRHVGRHSISRREFCLFVAKSRNNDAVQEGTGDKIYEQSVLQQIAKYRELGLNKQNELDATLRHARAGDNIFVTIEQDSGYILSFLTYPSYLDVDGDTVSLSNLQLASSIGEYWENQFAYVPFDTEAEWMEFYGDPWRGPSLEEALERYQEKHDIRGAQRLYHKARARKAPGTERSEQEFTRDLIKETELESWLSTHLEVVASDLQLYSDEAGNGRQYPAGAWAIDLLAHDSRNVFVVMELKKRLASDQVFGQLCRYVGWVRENLAGGRQVRGIIIAKELDDHLKYALKAIIGTEDTLKGFAWSDLGVEFEETGRDEQGNPIIRVISK